jgi:hypothetical protein
LLRTLCILLIFILLTCTLKKKEVDETPLIIEDVITLEGGQRGYTQQREDSLRGKITVTIDNYSDSLKTFGIIIVEE